MVTNKHAYKIYKVCKGRNIVFIKLLYQLGRIDDSDVRILSEFMNCYPDIDTVALRLSMEE